jgi:poly(3-hydroxybutyrate) depolymerase
MTFLGRKVRIWINPSATNAGPVVFYWHGTGMDPIREMPFGLGPGVQEIVDAGGLVAGFYSEPALACPGCSGIEALGTGNGVWYKKDFETADEVLACAIQQGRANTRHLHAAGMSAGGLQASAMAYERSNYLASVISYSGGKVFPVTRQDPENTLPIVLAHGGTEDTVLINFKTASEVMANELKPLGHFIVMCDHGRRHVWPAEFGSEGGAAVFFREHPYKVSPEPYAGGLPATMPSYCSIW